jgi:hypothetical protein
MSIPSRKRLPEPDPRVRPFLEVVAEMIADSVEARLAERAERLEEPLPQVERVIARPKLLRPLRKAG